jgi:hypothetical protein
MALVTLLEAFRPWDALLSGPAKPESGGAKRTDEFWACCRQPRTRGDSGRLRSGARARQRSDTVAPGPPLVAAVSSYALWGLCVFLRLATCTCIADSF